MPEIECWSGEHAPLILYALLNFVIFVIAVPFYLYTQLSSAGEKGRQKKAFAEAHGWITLRYKCVVVLAGTLASTVTVAESVDLS